MIPNTKNTKILKISFFCVLIVLGAGVAFIFRWRGVLNYGVAFLSFSGVFLSLFFALKDKLKNIEPIENHDITKDEKIPLSQKFALGMGVSFSMFRILSYAFLSFALIVLLEYQMFEIYAYFMGILIALCCVILGLLQK